ncbi:L-aspartate oxidase [Candidatus Poribacteria bacterium]
MSQSEDNIAADLALTRECSRYIMDFDLDQIPQIQTDFLVIGSGAAGLRAAIETGKHGQTLLVTKDTLDESNTTYAQGGIAVAINVGDEIGFHVEDTLRAGAGLCTEAAVEVMVEEGIDRVGELVLWGADFDKHNNELVFTMEAAHRMRRIIHARGDATGQETQNVLLRKASESESIRLMGHRFVVDLLTLNGRCFGALLLDEDDSTLLAVIAKSIILAAGGLCQIYKYTTNPDGATGDGCAVAYRAGCEMTDMEFVQFHPTTLCLPNVPRFLISEAVRGEGAILVNAAGERFMQPYHERAELAPRDVVSRAIAMETTRTNAECVFLDLRHLDAGFVKRRFPTINERCSGYGVDISKDLIPVNVSAHFMMGGVKTSARAETNISGLYACGEVACVGVHGANRLASNSLLETLVFSVRAATQAVEYANNSSPVPELKIRHQKKSKAPEGTESAEVRRVFRNLMWEKVGIVRRQEELQEALAWVKEHDSVQPATRSGLELQNMFHLSYLMIDGALMREESRGAHYRSDYPHRDDAKWRRHITFRRLSHDADEDSA